MSKTQKNVAAKRDTRNAIDRPFAPDILRRAKELAGKFQIVVRFDEEEGEYYGRGLELPNALGDGATPDACVTSTREAMVALIAFMLERGERPPSPSGEAGRTEQVNIRLTAQEKLLLEDISGRKGFRGVSDFMRAAAISEAERAESGFRK
jgi:predicted RNase H-like HicB family nuclease